MSSAPSGFQGVQAQCRRNDLHAEHVYQVYGVERRGSGVRTVDAEQLLADVRLVAQLADQDVRRFAADVLEACAAADAAQGAPGDVTTDEIRALLQRTADGR